MKNFNLAEFIEGVPVLRLFGKNLALNAGIAFVVFKTEFKPMKNQLSGNPQKTLMKMIVEKKSDKILGIHVVGDGAAELIQVAAVAVKMGATKKDFDATCAVHPTAAEELVTLN